MTETGGLWKGFSYANAVQAEEYESDGWITGALRIRTVPRDPTERELQDMALSLQSEGPDEYPFGYFVYLACEHFDANPPTDLAVKLRPPRRWTEIRSSLGRESAVQISATRCATEILKTYLRLYNAGWAAGSRGGSSKLWESGTSPHAWDDGYLDAVAQRPKWHLTFCTDHDDCGWPMDDD